MNLTKLAPVAKAVTGSLLAGLTALGVALADGHVAAAEWVGVGISALAVVAGVHQIPNTPQLVDPADEDLEDPNA